MADKENCDASFPTATALFRHGRLQTATNNSARFLVCRKLETVHFVHDSNSIFFDVRSGMLMEYLPWVWEAILSKTWTTCTSLNTFVPNCSKSPFPQGDSYSPYLNVFNITKKKTYSFCAHQVLRKSRKELGDSSPPQPFWAKYSQDQFWLATFRLCLFQKVDESNRELW